MNETELREIDIAVAEQVMGWKREKRKLYAGSQNVSGWGLNQHLPLGDFLREFIISVPYYTTNPADAMTVLKRCLDKTDLRIMKHPDGSIGIVAQPDVVESTLELAVCQFALKLYK